MKKPRAVLGSRPCSWWRAARPTTVTTRRRAFGRASGPVTFNVYAAASLKNTFTAIAGEFEKENDGVKVSLSFDGSSTLVNQIKQGAPADVFACRREEHGTARRQGH